MARLALVSAVILTLAAPAAAAGPAPLALAGRWRFQLDREDAGIKDRWFERALPESITLPGALQNQGFGDEISVRTEWTANVYDRTWYESPAFEAYRRPGNVKVPFWLQPDRHYVGAAWYQRDIAIPEEWRGKRVVLTLERPHWETRAWIGGRALGVRDSLSTPHVYDLGPGLAPGTHTLTLRADNRMIVDVGIWAHSVSDHTQGNWNGIVGRIELAATSPAWIDDVQAFPDLPRQTVRLAVRIGGSAAGKVTVRAGSAAAEVDLGADGAAVELETPLGAGARRWDEFAPELQRLSVALRGPGIADERVVTFGLREIAARGTRLVLNDRDLFLRGTLECCIFPLTGYPPTEIEAWKRVIRICKDHGLNHIRFHSWCPPEAAFAAADELGFYYQVEAAVWTAVGDGGPIDAWIYAETERILRAYGNHPSFLLMAHGNEPGGARRDEWLGRWVEHWKARDGRRLYTSGSGWPAISENQYHVTPAPRGPGGWIGKDYRASIRNLSAPVIVHEMGQWCVYPNFDAIAKHTGPLKARNFEIFRDSLAARGMLPEWRAFQRASGRFQALCYKEEVEAAFRTPGVSGVQLLDLHDFPGQGTALVGVLDAFWDEKGYIAPAEFRRFFGATVPLARMEKRVWTTEETFAAEVQVAHFGPAPLAGARPYWRLVGAAGRAAGGRLPERDVPIARETPLGRIAFPCADLKAPAAYRLVVGLEGTEFENDWTIWVYPAAVPPPAPAGVLVATALDSAVLAHLAAGGKAFLHSVRLQAAHPRGSFTPVFWNRQWFPGQACQTLGLLCDPAHPALAAFPTEAHCDWQWEDIVAHARCLVMDTLPRELRPIVQPIDDWNSNRKLGLVFECAVGRGALLVCTADLARDAARRPAARQLAHSLAAYAASPAFAPATAADAEDLRELLAPARASKLVALGATVLRASSEDAANGNVAANALDGDPETFWHTAWTPAPDPMPHELVIDLGKEIELEGLIYTPRQDMTNGRIAACEIHVSADAASWGAPAAAAAWRDSDRTETVKFDRPRAGRYLRILIGAEVRGNPFAAIAELDIIPARR